MELEAFRGGKIQESVKAIFDTIKKQEEDLEKDKEYKDKQRVRREEVDQVTKSKEYELNMPYGNEQKWIEDSQEKFDEIQKPIRQNDFEMDESGKPTTYQQITIPELQGLGGKVDYSLKFISWK